MSEEINNPSGLEKNDTLKDALKRADELAKPNGSAYSGMMIDRKDLRRIVLLVREYRKLESDIESVLELLEDVVNQSCQTKDKKMYDGEMYLDSMALSDYAAAMRFLAKHGRIVIDSEHGRRVIGRFKWMIKESKLLSKKG